MGNEIRQIDVFNIGVRVNYGMVNGCYIQNLDFDRVLMCFWPLATTTNTVNKFENRFTLIDIREEKHLISHKKGISKNKIPIFIARESCKRFAQFPLATFGKANKKNGGIRRLNWSKRVF